jgi:hypothetical protein
MREEVFGMKALVVYESMFGNTEQIGRAVAAGLGESIDVQVTEVTDAPTEPDPQVALIVAGGPTHAFHSANRRCMCCELVTRQRVGESRDHRAGVPDTVVVCRTRPPQKARHP